MINIFAFIAKKLSIFDSYNTPDRQINTILDLDPFELRKNDISKLIFDLDQTVVIQGTSQIPEDILEKINAFKKEFGSNHICFLSNEFNEKRAAEIEKITEIKVVRSDFKKPSPKAFEQALKYLNVNASKSIAMIGDRLFTDILGAIKIGLYTIQVSPLSPQDDSPGARFFRFFEIPAQKYGFSSFIKLFLAFLTIAGIGLFEFIHMAKDFFTNSFMITISDNLNIIHFIFVGVVNFFYWSFTLPNLNFENRGKWYTGISYYFNTYPLFLRYLFSWILLIIAFFFKSLVPDYFLSIAIFYSFFIHLAMLASLSSFYHSHSGRVSRVFLDIIIIFIIGNTLEVSYTKYALIFLLVPVGTSSKHFDWAGCIITFIFSTAAAVYLLLPNVHEAVLFGGLFFGLMLMMKVDAYELTNPIDNFVDKFYSAEEFDTYDVLKHYAKILNCEAAFYIKSEDEGFYYSQYNKKDNNGPIHNISNKLTYNYLNEHSDLVIDSPNVSLYRLRKMQKSLLSEFKIQITIRPLPIEGIRSIMVCKVPDIEDKYLIFINSFTRNGITKMNFSKSHSRTMYLCSILLSNSLL